MGELARRTRNVWLATNPDGNGRFPDIEFSDIACLEGVDTCDYSCHKTRQGYL